MADGIPKSISATIADIQARTGAMGDPEPLIRPIEPGEPFPVEALPPIMQAGVKGIVGRTLVDPGLAAPSVLAVWSLVAQGHANVQTIGGSYAPLSQFFLSIAKSGERKTSADNLACSAIEEREGELRKAFAEDCEKQRVKLNAWQKEEKKILSAKKEDCATTEARLVNLGSPPRAPFTPLLTCPEPTFEGLCRLLAEGTGLAGVFSSEGGQFIGGHGMKEEEKRKTGSNVSSVWDGLPIKRVRGGDGIQILAHRRVSMNLMVQPGMAAAFLGDTVLQDQGLFARFLVASPASRMGRRLFREPTHEETLALTSHTAAVKRALSLPLPRQLDRPDTADPGELWPRGLKLTAGAKVALIQFSDWCEGLLSPGQQFAALAISGFGNKLCEHATRLAGVFTLAGNMHAEEVDKDAAQAGIIVARWYADERLRIIEAGAIDPKVQTAEALRVWLFTEWDEPNIAASDVAQYGPALIRDTERARQALEMLAQKSWLEPLQGGGEVKGKKRREAWRIRREVAP